MDRRTENVLRYRDPSNLIKYKTKKLSALVALQHCTVLHFVVPLN